LIIGKSGHVALVILRKKIVNLSATALEGFVWRVRRAVKLEGTVNVLLTGSAEIRALNRRFRGKNMATDVLSFPTDRLKTNARPLAGDIAISAEIAAQNAASLGHSPAEEVKILTLHGILHLAGFDHERDRGEMARKEAAMRRRFRLPTGLIERAETASEKFRQRSKRRGAKERWVQ
jgi:probable rRNA maturation factor